MKNSTRSIIILAFVFLIVFFYESKKIATLSVGMENSVLSNVSLFFTSNAEKIKSSVGLTEFFNKEENFWKNIKISPKIFDYPDNYTWTPNSKILPQNIVPDAPYSILIVGDSFIAERFGVQLEKEFLEYKDIKIYREGIYSTGLSRPDYFDWNEELKKLINSHNPNVAIVMFGANDGQDQRLIEGRIIHYGTAEWNEEYAKRVFIFLNILKENKIYVLWLGNPLPRDQYYLEKMQNLNSIFQTGCENFQNCYYISTWDFLADPDGNYSAYLSDETGRKKLARTSDGIHVTVFGSQFLINGVMAKIKEKINIEPTDNILIK